MCERRGIGAGVCERSRAAAAAEAVCDRGAGVWDPGEEFVGEMAGVWERVGDSDFVGREDIETCIELNREIGDVYDDWEGLYGVGNVEMLLYAGAFSLRFHSSSGSKSAPSRSEDVVVCAGA